MSQYPPPYSPQQPGYGGYPPQPLQSPEELLAPARRAGTLMIVLGALSVLCGLYMAWQSGSFDLSTAAATPELQRQMQQQIEAAEKQTGVSFRTVMLVMGVIPLATGAVLGGLGFYVRGGSLGVVVTGTVVVGCMLLVTGVTLLLGVLQGAAVGGPAFAAAAACQCGIPFGMLILLMVWLIQAARSASRIAMARQQHQAQMWHYQQYQQAYLQQGQQATPQHPALPGQPPASGMGYHYAPPQAPGQPGERKDPPDGTPPAE